MTGNAIQQFAVDYLKVEDRMLLRLSAAGQDGSLRMLLTRRFLRMFWAGLVAELHKSLAGTKSAAARDFLLDMAESRAVANADFATPFREPAAAKAPPPPPSTPPPAAGTAAPPVAAAPAETAAAPPDPLAGARLLWAFNITRKQDGFTSMVVVATDNARFDINLADDGVFGLMKILRDAAQSAEWELPMEWGSAMAPQAAPEPSSPRRLN
jgi:hypothetical protein